MHCTIFICVMYQLHNMYCTNLVYDVMYQCHMTHIQYIFLLRFLDPHCNLYPHRCLGELLFFCGEGSRKIKLGHNRVHVRDTDMKIPASCMEFRPGSNGTSPGA